MAAMMKGRSVGSDLRLGWKLAVRDIQNRYVNSFAGAAWSVGVPLLFASITAVVFSILMNGRLGIRYSEIPFAIFYFVPFSIWSLFNDTVSRSTGILKDYSYLISKIAFPYWVLPLVPLASATINQAILFSIAMALMVANNVPLSEHAYLYALAWIIMLFLVIGLSYAVAAISVYIPDLGQLIPVLINIAFWLTPILYPATLVDEGGALWVRNVIMHWNPFYYLVELSRFAIFEAQPAPISGVIWTGVLSVAVFIAGGLTFRKLRRGFADVL